MSQSSAGYFSGGLISGSAFANLHYPVTGGFVYNLFDTASTYWADGTTLTTTNTNFTTGSIGSTFPTYTISQLGVYQFKANFDISSIFKNSVSSGSYIFTITKNGTTTLYTSTTTHLSSTNAWDYFTINASTSPTSFISGDTVVFKLQLSNFSTNNFTSSVSS